MIPLLYFFTSTADGAEPRAKSSLKWRAASSKPAITTAVEAEAKVDVEVKTDVAEEAEAKPAKSAEPKTLVADETAKPISGEAKPMRRDNQIRLTQATNPLSKPIPDPFGDGVKSKASTPPGPFDPKAPLSTTTTDPLPTSSQLAIAPGGFQQEPCPELKDMKRISQISNIIAASPGDLPRECYFDETVIGPMNRHWLPTTYTWKASGLCHKPLYFEEVALERYGHSTGPISQPIVSGAHFFATLPLLPYKMGLNPPWECKYALGYYRPGSCAPYIVPPIPISGRAIAAEAAAVSGAIFLFP